MGQWPFTSGMLLCKEAILPSWKDIEGLKVLGREARSLKGMETFVCCERSKHSKPLPLRGYDWKDVSWLRHKINSALKVVEVQLWTRERALRVLNGSLDFTQIKPRRRRLYPNGVGGEEAQPVAASRPDRTSLQIVEKSRCPLHAVMLQGTCTFNSCRIYWISSFILNCHVIFLHVFQRQRVTKTRSYVCMNILFLGQPFCPHRSFLILLHWKNRAFIDGATKQNKKHQKRFYIIYMLLKSSCQDFKCLKYLVPPWPGTSLPQSAFRTSPAQRDDSDRCITIQFSIRSLSRF